MKKRRTKTLGAHWSPAALSPSGTGAIWLVVIAAVLSPLAADAVPQLENTYGGQNAFYLPRINGMAGTGVNLYRGGLSNIFNPALLVSADGVRVDLAGAVDFESEDRYQPLFDTFDSYVTDVAIASNNHQYFHSGLGVALPLLRGGLPLALGLSLADRYPFAYTFEEELRNPDADPGDDRDRITANRKREVTGTLRDLSAGLGVGVGDRLMLGATANYAFGTRKDTWQVRNFVDPDSSYNDTYEFQMSGVNFVLGASVVLNERFSLGLTWESPLEVDGDHTVTHATAAGDTLIATHESVKYPDYFGAGLTFRPRNDPRTVFTIEATYARWSKLEDSRNTDGATTPLDDTWDMRVGVEHTFYNDMPLRFGFRRYDSYADRDVGTSVFSAGTGMRAPGGLVSVSIEISKTTAVLPHQFPYPDMGDAYYSDPDARVEDSLFRIGIGYSGEF